MLEGSHIHCRPKRRSPIVEGLVIGEIPEFPMNGKIVLCPMKTGIYCECRLKLSYPSCLYPGTTIVGPEIEKTENYS